MEEILNSIVKVQNLIKVKRDNKDNDEITKAIAKIKKDISVDNKNVLSKKFAELTEQFVSSSNSITEEFTELKQHNESL